MKRMHDGPVTHAVRSNYYQQVVVTVGGKIFAVWRDDFGEPLVWKKSNVRWVKNSRGGYRPTLKQTELPLPRQSKRRALSDSRRVQRRENDGGDKKRKEGCTR